MPRSAARTRDRILETAYRLFYREGFLRAGVDAVAGAAGVTKRTLYNHFPSKDHLIAEVLEHQAELATAELSRQVPEGAASAEVLIRALFGGMHAWTSQPGWRGSGFTRAAMELAWAPGHPARTAAARHKLAREVSLATALAALGVTEPDAAARRLCLLMEGAMALTLLHGGRVYLDEAEAAALRLNAGPVSDPGGCA